MIVKVRCERHGSAVADVALEGQVFLGIRLGLRVEH